MIVTMASLMIGRSFIRDALGTSIADYRGVLSDKTRMIGQIQ